MSGGPRVTFVGAGPGAPDLLTFRAARAIAEADVVGWARSLGMAETVLEHARAGAEVIESASLTLEQPLSWMVGMIVWRYAAIPFIFAPLNTASLLLLPPDKVRMGSGLILCMPVASMSSRHSPLCTGKTCSDASRMSLRRLGKLILWSIPKRWLSCTNICNSKPPCQPIKIALSC